MSEKKNKFNTKKIIIVLVALAVIFGVVAVIIHFTTRVTNESYEKCVIGDVNGDGNINSADALCVVKHVSKIEELFDSQQKNGDVNGDGKLDTSDALILLRYSVGEVTALPFKEAAPVNRTVEDDIGQKVIFENDKVKVTAQVVNNWKNSDKTQSYQILMIATNKTNKPFTDWSLKVNLNQAPMEITKNWDCELETEKNVITLTGSPISSSTPISFGFIAKSSSEITIDKVIMETVEVTTTTVTSTASYYDDYDEDSDDDYDYDDYDDDYDDYDEYYD